MRPGDRKTRATKIRNTGCSLPSRVELEQRPVFVVDSQALVTVDGDGAVQLWSTDDCRGVHTLHGPRL